MSDEKQKLKFGPIMVVGEPGYVGRSAIHFAGVHIVQPPTLTSFCKKEFYEAYARGRRERIENVTQMIEQNKIFIKPMTSAEVNAYFKLFL